LHKIGTGGHQPEQHGVIGTIASDLIAMSALPPVIEPILAKRRIGTPESLLNLKSIHRKIM